MFAALFFVSIGMLIDLSLFKDHILSAVIVSGVFIAGKIVANTAGTFVAGQGAGSPCKWEWGNLRLESFPWR
jgi:monovalent cation:H+ antiporter-2, CPA2 family